MGQSSAPPSARGRGRGSAEGALWSPAGWGSGWAGRGGFVGKASPWRGRARESVGGATGSLWAPDCRTKSWGSRGTTLVVYPTRQTAQASLRFPGRPQLTLEIGISLTGKESSGSRGSG